MKDIIHFIELSKYAGQRFDLVQAGGGNSSVKLDDGTMLIKASGYSLSEVELIKGYCKVNNAQLIEILNNPDVTHQQDKKQREIAAATLTQKALHAHQPNRPSIETLLHSMLEKYVLHTHPIVVNALACKPTWKTILEHLFDDAVYVAYHTPGIDLALALKKEIASYKQKANKQPSVIFLQNHGLIVTASTHEKIMFLIEQILLIIEQYLAVDFNRYKQTTAIASLVNAQTQSTHIAYFSDDQELKTLLTNKKHLFFAYPFCPDTLVYCGFQPLELDHINNHSAVAIHKFRYHELPKIIIYQDHLFFIAQSIKKAKESEEVFKFHLLALDLATTTKDGTLTTHLVEKELSYLQNWEAEKYRQNT